jgi:hypothetical protein
MFTGVFLSALDETVVTPNITTLRTGSSQTPTLPKCVIFGINVYSHLFIFRPIVCLSLSPFLFEDTK